MPAAIFARLCLVEARRGGLPWLAAACVLAALAFAAFLSQLAITEARALQVAALAAVLRASLAFMVAAHVTASTLREINDKGMEFFLALPFARSTQYLGRLCGFAAGAAALGLFFSLALLPWAPPAAVLLWGVSLALEAALVAAAALFFAMTLAQLVPAIAATLGLYVLARSMAAVQAIAAAPLAGHSDLSRLAAFLVDAAALVLPPLDAVTRTEWLLYAAPSSGAYIFGMGMLVLYGVLLAAAGLFDFHRRSF